MLTRQSPDLHRFPWIVSALLLVNAAIQSLVFFGPVTGEAGDTLKGISIVVMGGGLVVYLWRALRDYGLDNIVKRALTQLGEFLGVYIAWTLVVLWLFPPGLLAVGAWFGGVLAIVAILFSPKAAGVRAFLRAAFPFVKTR